MKIIDLLNKIANEEEVPDGIKWGCHDFKWFVYEYKSINELGEPTLLDYLSQCPQMLNDEIITFNKIEEKKIPEKLPKSVTDNAGSSKDMRLIAITLNEIIDYLKSKGDE